MTDGVGGRAGVVAAWWALAGVVGLLLQAVTSLGARGAATVAGGLTPFEWMALVLLSAAFLYGEGVRAIGRRWVPHVVARIRRLRSDPRPLWVALAPLYAMALVGGGRRQVALAWAGVAGIVTAVLIVRQFPEPWRGITDLAVATALAWGAGALVVAAARARVTRAA